MTKKLAAKNALIELPVANKLLVAPALGTAMPIRTRTAVGGMAQFVTTQSPIHREAQELREIVDSFEGALVVRALAPSSIMPSQWANRHDTSYETEDFEELKREIREAGSNVQPIKVRPLNRSTPVDDNVEKYEIVYGHRRHRACLELKIPINALIETVDYQTLFEQMERENRGRKNLSAWEQGCMYLAAIDKGLYASQRKLSESIGVDISLISKSIALARLPTDVINAFPSPLEIQFRWAQPLGEALKNDADAMMAQVEAITIEKKTKMLTAGEVFTRLTSTKAVIGRSIHTSELAIHGKRVGEWIVSQHGGVALKLRPQVIAEKDYEAFLNVVMTFLKAS
jgi:ParB family chromosome partitioning protein